jgi:crossover junction endodeoxyribonuclease RusA
VSNEVIFGWPPRECSPNWRGHWSKRAKAVKSYRHACWALTKAAKVAINFDGPVHLWITFNKPSRREMDDDNLIASFKPGRDGLADALGIDDKRFVSHPFVSGRIAGSVVVRLSRGPE